MAISEFEIKRIEKVVGQYVESKRPPAHLRNKVDLTFRITGQSIEIYELREQWNNPEKKIESSIAKITYVKKTKAWKIYWQRADLKWHKYEPNHEMTSLEKALGIIEADEYGCFWG